MSPLTMVWRRGGQRREIASLEEAQAAWIAYRDGTGLGASQIGEGARIVREGKTIAYVSYNGRVWAGARYVPGAEPILEVTR